jgi:hypothetical protein
MTMTRKLFSIAPAAFLVGALTATAAAAAAVHPARDALAPSAAARAQAVGFAQAQMQAAPKKKAGGPAARGKPAALAPACPKGQQWNAVHKMCMPAGPAATPIPLPGTR